MRTSYPSLLNLLLSQSLPHPQLRPQGNLLNVMEYTVINYNDRYEWFQNDTFITIEVFVKNVKADAVTLSFFDNSASNQKKYNGCNINLFNSYP